MSIPATAHSPKGQVYVGQGLAHVWRPPSRLPPSSQAEVAVTERQVPPPVPRRLGLLTIFLPLPHKAPLTLFPLTDTRPRAPRLLQRAILRLQVLSSGEDLGFIDQTTLLDPYFIWWKILTAPITATATINRNSSDPWPR